MYPLDKKTRDIVGCYVGERGEIGAKALWNSLPPVYRQCAVCYTDFWAAYAQVIPKNRHKAVGKETGLTNHIERFIDALLAEAQEIHNESLSGWLLSCFHKFPGSPRLPQRA